MGTPPAEELLRKIQELEGGQAHLKQELSKLMISGNAKSEQPANHHHHQRSQSVSPQRSALPQRRGGLEAGTAARKKGSASFRYSSPLQRESRSREPVNAGGAPAVTFTDGQYFNLLQSMGQAVHIFDVNGRIIYWNRTAENLYGYSAAEALGQDAIELLIEPQNFSVANNVVHRVTRGESRTGQIPVKNKKGESFSAVTTNTPFYDDDGSLIGIICVSSDSRHFQEMRVELSAIQNSEPDSSFSRPRSGLTIANKLGLDSQQPLQVAIASKISNLASKVSSKVKSRIRTGENSTDREGGSGDSHHTDHSISDAGLSDHREDTTSSGASTPMEDIAPSPFGAFSHGEEYPGKGSRDSCGENEGKPAIHKIITSKAEAWIGKKGCHGHGK